MLKLLSTIGVSGLLSGCLWNGGPYKLSQNPAAKQIMNRTWNLYSRDIIDTTGGEKIYLSRTLMDSCFTSIHFLEKDSLAQHDSCSGGVTSDTTGHWTWYSNNGILVAQIFTNEKEEDFKYLYNLEGDTLQMSIRPLGFPDSTELKQYLRALTFVAH